MQVQAVIEQFRGVKVLVLGELMLDVYLSGSSGRICREAPVPVVDVAAQHDVPGGAANTAINLAALGAQTVFLTVSGDDPEAHSVHTQLTAAGVETSCILRDPARQTLSKKRVVADDQLIVRFDTGTTEPVSAACEEKLIEHLQTLYPVVDAVVVSDYGYGIVTDSVITALSRLQAAAPKPLIIDSKALTRFREIAPTVVKPNYQEAVQLLNIAPQAGERRVLQMLAYERELLNITGARSVALTLDSDGAVIFQRDAAPLHTPSVHVRKARTAGAGDTYVSVLALTCTLGLSMQQTAELAAAAAGIVVQKEDTALCRPHELLRAFTGGRILRDMEELQQRVSEYRGQAHSIVFTNGCFDMLHIGHTTYLQQAKAHGDVLIVGVNSDESVSRLKGDHRPVNTLEDRMRMLAALDCVDHVIAFGEDSPLRIIQEIQPDWYVKGGDYTAATLPEARVVEAYGGKVEIVPYVVNRSTTAVIHKIRSLG